jgi:hypothetical protein
MPISIVHPACRRPLVLGAAVVVLGLPGFAGEISGSVDGRPVDVGLDCSGLPDGPVIEARSAGDAGLSLADKNGDGLMVSVIGMTSAGKITFDIRFGAERYAFGGPWDSLEGTMLTFTGTMGDAKGDGYPVDLAIDCGS